MPAPDRASSPNTSPLLHGVDFTSAPRSRKGITIASGALDGDTFRLQGLLTLSDFPAFVSWLDRPGPWLGGFDFPFSLPRELIEVISKYVKVNPEDIKISLDKQGNLEVLDVNVVLPDGS